MTVPYKIKSVTEVANTIKEAFAIKTPRAVIVGKYIPNEPKHQMPTLEGSENWPSDYVLSESHVKLDHQIETKAAFEREKLESDLRFEKESYLLLKHENEKLIEQNKEYEVKYKNSEFANQNLQAKLDKLEGTEQYSLWLMQQYLNVKKQLASVEDKGMGRSEWI